MEDNEPLNYWQFLIDLTVYEAKARVHQDMYTIRVVQDETGELEIYTASGDVRPNRLNVKVYNGKITAVFGLY